jgi:hypothetical protein
MAHDWVDGFPGSVVICDTQGIILEMNDKAIEDYHEAGGAELIGSYVQDCHPEAVRPAVDALFKSPQNSISIKEKNGTYKLIYEVPWYKNGEYRGFVCLNLQIPPEALPKSV